MPRVRKIPNVTRTVRTAGQERARPRKPGRRRLLASLAVVLAMGMVAGTQESAGAAPAILGSSAPFGVLAGSAVTSSNLTAVTGDLGVGSGGTVSGFPPGTVSGTVHNGDTTAVQALTDATTAYNDLAGRTPVTTVASQLGGTTKAPGVYNSADGTFSLSGTLTLDAQTDPDAVFVFRANTLSAANVSNVNLIGGAQADNIFWQIGNSATLGTFCTFRGNLLASNSVTVDSGAAVYGRVFSLNDTVTIVGTGGIPKTRISVPNDPPTTTSLTTSVTPSREGQSVTFTATVTPVTGSLAPQGQVAFKDGSTVLGTDQTDQSAVATFTTSALTAGNHSIVAVYLGGDTPDNEAVVHFAPSTSPPVEQIVTASIWADTETPATVTQDDPNAITVGVRFRASTDGAITGIRFYKGSQNTGTHTGSLWTNNGQLLTTAVFSNETASGWQQVIFSTPVVTTANTTYVASYHTTSGYYSTTRPYFTTAHTNGSLTALANGTDGSNGVYTYGASSTFPTSTYLATNYWVDVLFVPATTLWDTTDTPATASHDDSNPITVGVRFRADSDGTVTGIRFYKGSQNTGTHTGSLWTNNGQLLATVTFTNETASGWQKANFSTPVSITANTAYVASYHTTSGYYSVTRPYFTGKRTRGPLTAPANSASGGNGIYAYGANNAFPRYVYLTTNYWVDVLFEVT